MYQVLKCTTDKLEATLNDFKWDAPEWDVELVRLQHVGGRDWVVVIRARAV